MLQILLYVTELLQKGAKVSATDDKGNTPLHLAAMKGFPDVARELLRWGADPHVVNNDGKVPLEISLCYALSEVKINSTGHGVKGVDNIEDFNDFSVLMCRAMKPSKLVPHNYKE